MSATHTPVGGSEGRTYCCFTCLLGNLQSTCEVTATAAGIEALSRRDDEGAFIAQARDLSGCTVAEIGILYTRLCTGYEGVLQRRKVEVGVARTWVWILTRRECIGSRDSRDSSSDEETEEGTHGELWYRGLGKKPFRERYVRWEAGEECLELLEFLYANAYSTKSL